MTINRILMGGGGRFGGRGRAPNAEGGTPPPETPPAAPADQTALLKQGVSLIVKGKSPVNPDAVMSMNQNATIFFGFAKDALPLAVTDKEVEFTIKLPGVSAKTKFNLKDMIYNEQLAL